MSSKPNDPTEWANRRKAAVERARQLREDRKNALTDGDTFQPQVNARVPTKPADSLDRLTNQVARTNDPMEMPLPGSRKPEASHNPQGDLPPSPNSDALGRELKKFGGQSGNQAARDAQYKSQFLQQYEDQKRKQRDDREATKSKQTPVEDHHSPPTEQDDAFYSMLRSDSSARNAGPGWNADTSPGGFDAPPQKRGMAGRQRGDPPAEKTSRPILNRGPGATISPRGGYGGNENSSNGVKPSPRSNELAIAKPQLSLLKSRIRQSESAGSKSFSGKQSLGLPEQQPTESMGAGRRTAPDPSLANDAYQFNPGRERRAGVPPARNEWDSAQTSNPRRGVAANGDVDDAYAPTAQRRVPASNRGASRFDDDEQATNFPPNRRQQPVAGRRGSGGFDDSGLDSGDAFGGPPPASKRRVAPTSTRNNVDDDYSQPPTQAQPSAQRQPPTRQPQQQQQQHPQRAQAQPPAAQMRSPNPIDDAPVPALAKQAGFVQPSPYPDDDEYDQDNEEAPMEGQQLQCPDCGRKFNPVPFEKHVKICQKVFQKKRKVFDSSKMRIADNPELLKINMQAKKEEMKAAKKAAAAGKSAPADDFFPPKKAAGAQQPDVVGEAQPKWKSQSNALRDAMKAMRDYQKAKDSGAPLPPPVVTAPDPSLVPCPHCGRRFNEKAAERHIPQCQNIKAKPSTLKKGSGVGVGTAVAKKGR